MCTVSMGSDHYTDKWSKSPSITLFPIPQVTKEEFDSLTKEVKDLKELLKRAVKYDKDNNEPNCHLEDKIKLLKQVADLVGVSLEDVFNQ